MNRQSWLYRSLWLPTVPNSYSDKQGLLVIKKNYDILMIEDGIPNQDNEFIAV